MAKIDVLDPAGKKSASRDLAAEIFEHPVNVPLMHQVVVAQLAAARTQRIVELQGGLEATLMGEIVHQPETAEQERAFFSLQAVGRLVDQIAIEKTVARAQPLLHGLHRGHHARMIRGDHPAQRQGQDAGIQPAAADNGTALGAAYYVWHQELDQPRRFVMERRIGNGTADDRG